MASIRSDLIALKLTVMILTAIAFFVIIDDVNTHIKLDKLRQSIENSRISCRPVKMDDKYFCGSRILIEKSTDKK